MCSSRTTDGYKLSVQKKVRRHGYWTVTGGMVTGRLLEAWLLEAWLLEAWLLDEGIMVIERVFNHHTGE